MAQDLLLSAQKIMASLIREAQQVGEAEWQAVSVKSVNRVLHYCIYHEEVTASEALEDIRFELTRYEQNPPFRFQNPNPIMPADREASRWRSAYGYQGKGGMVILHAGEVAGWVSGLQHVESWQPASLAVEEDGTIWESSIDKEWVPFDPKKED